jgi:hypothetical protein
LRVNITPNHLAFNGMPLKWAMIARSLNAVDADVIQDDMERTVFELHRENVQSAVIAAFALAWMDERQVSNVNLDVRELLGA